MNLTELSILTLAVLALWAAFVHGVALHGNQFLREPRDALHGGLFAAFGIGLAFVGGVVLIRFNVATALAASQGDIDKAPVLLAGLLVIASGYSAMFALERIEKRLPESASVADVTLIRLANLLNPTGVALVIALLWFVMSAA